MEFNYHSKVVTSKVYKPIFSNGLMVDNQEIVSLDEIVANENFIIADTGAGRRMKGQWYAEGLYDKKYFGDVDTPLLEDISTDLGSMDFLFKSNGTYTVPKVVQELTRFSDLLKHKLDKLILFSNAYGKHKKRKGKENSEDYSEAELENKRLLSDISFRTMAITKKASRRIIAPQSPEIFRGILNLVNNVGKIPGVKKNFNQRYNQTDYRKNPDLHADEEIAAMSIYLSAIENTSNAIVTSDSDIQRLVCYSITRLEKMGRWSGVRDLIQDCPLRVYFMKPECDAVVPFDTSKSFDFL